MNQAAQDLILETRELSKRFGGIQVIKLICKSVAVKCVASLARTVRVKVPFSNY